MVTPELSRRNAAYQMVFPCECVCVCVFVWICFIMFCIIKRNLHICEFVVLIIGTAKVLAHLQDVSDHWWGLRVFIKMGLWHR